MLCFVEISPSIPKIFRGLYGCGGYLGHVTWIICINLFLLPEEAPHKILAFIGQAVSEVMISVRPCVMSVLSCCPNQTEVQLI